MGNPEYETEEAKFLSEVIGIFKGEIKHPLMSTLVVSLNSLLKAIDASVSLRSAVSKVLDYIKENWRENTDTEL